MNLHDALGGFGPSPMQFNKEPSKSIRSGRFADTDVTSGRKKKISGVLRPFLDATRERSSEQ